MSDITFKDALRASAEPAPTDNDTWNALLESRAKLERELKASYAREAQLRAALEEVDANLYAPDPNCWCHISPPCNDCVENGETREVLAIVKKALSLPPPPVVPVEDMKPLLEALKLFANRFIGDLSGIGGGTCIALSLPVGLFKDAKSALSTFTAKHPTL